MTAYLRGKKVYIDEVHIDTEPCDCYIQSAYYADGTELSESELTELNEGFDGYEIWFENKIQQGDFAAD
jgi:hypothetical protein